MIRMSHLETDITQACQLSCVACNHSVPLWRTRRGGPWSTTLQTVVHDLRHLAKFVHADRWGALGGEPTLHHDIVNILHAARDSGIADRTELWTNGLTLQKMGPEFWSSFDILVLSIYPDKLKDHEVSWIIKKCDDSHIELVIKDEVNRPNFRTMLERIPTDAQATLDKYRGCFFRGFSRSASYGFFFTCCCGPHIPMLLQGKSFGTDGVPIAGLTEEVLRAYLDQAEPLGACTVCAGRDTAVPILWSEERHPLAWVEKSRGGLVS